MVAFFNDDNEVRFDDLSPDDQMKVNIGRVIANAMHTGMLLSRQPGYASASTDVQAAMMTAMCVTFVSSILDIFRKEGN
jgi:hypothetical protein